MLLRDKNKLPNLDPTDKQSPEFWEWLGRTIATCSYLECILKHAIYAFSSNKTTSNNVEERTREVETWLKSLDTNLTLQLKKLIDKYAKEAKDANVVERFENFDKLIEDLNSIVVYRNLFCHSVWNATDSPSSSVPMFFYKQKSTQAVDCIVDVDLLKKTQKFISDITVGIIRSVDVMGWKFIDTDNGDALP